MAKYIAVSKCPLRWHPLRARLTLPGQIWHNIGLKLELASRAISEIRVLAKPLVLIVDVVIHLCWVSRDVVTWLAYHSVYLHLPCRSKIFGPHCKLSTYSRL